MSRSELLKMSITQLCVLAGISYKYYKKWGFSTDQLIEIILTPNN